MTPFLLKLRLGLDKVGAFCEQKHGKPAVDEVPVNRCNEGTHAQNFETKITLVRQETTDDE